MILFYSKLKNGNIAKGNHCVTVEAYKENDNIEVQVKDDDFIQNAPERLNALKKRFISYNDEVYANIDLNGLAPMNHASTSNHYGVANLIEYGHVKNIITPHILEEALKKIRAMKTEAIKPKPVVKQPVTNTFKKNPASFSFVKGDETNQFKHWKEIKKGVYRCGPTKIATKTGTYNKPSPLKFRFGFKIPQEARIDKVIFKYSDRVNNVIIDKPSIKFSGFKKSYSADKPTKKGSPHRVIINEAYKNKWEPDHLNKLNITLSYPKNTNTDTGYLYVTDVQVIVNYTI